MTSLFSGERVYKDDLRVDAYGSLDELDAHIGDAKHLVPESLKLELIQIQRQLYRAMGHLASKSGEYPLPLLDADVEELTTSVHHYESLLQLKGFVVPGSIPASAKLDICRTIARRAERRVIALSREEEVPAPILGFVNRLSDYFFITARWVEDLENAIEYKKSD